MEVYAEICGCGAHKTRSHCFISPPPPPLPQIEELTGARVNFKDDFSGPAAGPGSAGAAAEGDGATRTVLIRGTGAAAQRAELEVQRIVASLPPVETDSITVPERCIGRIIGELGGGGRERGVGMQCGWMGGARGGWGRSARSRRGAGRMRGGWGCDGWVGLGEMGGAVRVGGSLCWVG